MNELNDYIVKELGVKYFNEICDIKSNFFATDAYKQIVNRIKEMNNMEAIATKWHLISYGMDLVDELSSLVSRTKMKKNKLSVLIPLIFILNSKLNIASGVHELTEYYDRVDSAMNDVAENSKN